LSFLVTKFRKKKSPDFYLKWTAGSQNLFLLSSFLPYSQIWLKSSLDDPFGNILNSCYGSVLATFGGMKERNPEETYIEGC
jgi:hypothetical protein